MGDIVKPFTGSHDLVIKSFGVTGDEAETPGIEAAWAETPDATTGETIPLDKLEHVITVVEDVVAEKVPAGTVITDENAGKVVDASGTEHTGTIPAAAATEPVKSAPKATEKPAK